MIEEVFYQCTCPSCKASKPRTRILKRLVQFGTVLPILWCVVPSLYIYHQFLLPNEPSHDTLEAEDYPTLLEVSQADVVIQGSDSNDESAKFDRNFKESFARSVAVKVVDSHGAVRRQWAQWLLRMLLGVVCYIILVTGLYFGLR